MSRFDYLLVLLAILAGLALTEILSDIAKLCRAAEHVSFYWLPFVWALLCFLLLVQWWWNLWTWKPYVHEMMGASYPAFLLSLVFPTFLYAACVLLFPDVSGDNAIDMRKHYFQEHSWFFGCCTIRMITLTIGNSISLKMSLFHPENLVRYFAIAVLSSCAFIANERLHIAAAAVCLALLVIFIAFFSSPMAHLRDHDRSA